MSRALLSKEVKGAGVKGASHFFAPLGSAFACARAHTTRTNRLLPRPEPPPRNPGPGAPRGGGLASVGSQSTGYPTTARDAVEAGHAEFVLADLESQWGPCPSYA